jgi:rfaE bifunctional protein nucleotidyltransferase chain/domain
MDKIMSRDQLPQFQSLPAVKGKRVVLVGGCYDLLHYGHYAFFKAAKQEGDVLVVLLESDEFIQKRKKRQPVHTQKQRAEIIAGLEVVDYVVTLPNIEENSDYRAIVEEIQPTVIAVTEGDINIKYKEEHAKAVGGTVKTVVSMLHPFSTSSIIQYANLLSD